MSQFSAQLGSIWLGSAGSAILSRAVATLPLVLDWDVGSSYVDCHCLAYSTYAGGNCNLDVPFCGMCNTQLHVSLFSLLHVLFAYILPWACTLLEAWLQGPFLHFL